MKLQYINIMIMQLFTEFFQSGKIRNCKFQSTRNLFYLQSHFGRLGSAGWLWGWLSKIRQKKSVTVRKPFSGQARQKMTANN